MESCLCLVNRDRERQRQSRWVYSIELGNGVPEIQYKAPEAYPHVVVSDLKGLTEAQFMDKIEQYSGWNSFLWVPGVVDCHSELEGAFEYAGVTYPGAPNGRVDYDENITNTLKNIENQVNDLFNQFKSSFGSTGNSASGGFVLYPNKPNTNMMHQVYSK